MTMTTRGQIMLWSDYLKTKETVNIMLRDLCETLIVYIFLSTFQLVHMVMTVNKPDVRRFTTWIESADWNLCIWSLIHMLFVALSSVWCDALHSGDTNWPKQAKIEVHNQYLKSCILKIGWDITHTHLTYTSNWNKHIERFCMWNVCFDINWSSLYINQLVLMSWPLREIYFYLLNY